MIITTLAVLFVLKIARKAVYKIPIELDTDDVNWIHAL
jgi:hypothetical protein